MQMEEKGCKYLERLIYMAYLAAVLLVVVLAYRYVLPIAAELLAYVPSLLMPLIVAIILAVVMEPLVSLLGKYVSRLWATLFSFVIVLGGFALVITGLAIIAMKQISELYLLTLEHSDQIIALTLQSIDEVRVFFLHLDVPPEARDLIEKGLTSGADSLKDILNSIVKGLGSGLSSVPEMVVFIVIAAMATFFVVKDQAAIIAVMQRALPEEAIEKISFIIRRLYETLLGFLRSYTIIILITSVITIIGLSIMGVESAFMLGFIISFLDIVPVIGSGLVLIPWIIISFVTGKTLLGVELILLWGLVAVVRQMIEPKIVGDNIGLHPLVSLLSIYVGLKLAGFIGMLLGPATVVIVLAMAKAGLFESIIPWINTSRLEDDSSSEVPEEGAVADE